MVQIQKTNLEKALSDDTVFNLVNKKYISLQDNDVKRNNIYLDGAIKVLIQKMQEMDPVFKSVYSEIIYCGSFYKGTKVGKPNEFDLNIVLRLPIDSKKLKLISRRPAFTQIFIEDPSCQLLRLSKNEKNRLNKLICDNYLNPNKFREWIEGVLSKVITELPLDRNMHVLKVQTEQNSFVTLIKIKKSGPAFTIIFNISQINEEIHVDLVPVLVFNECTINGTTLKLSEIKKYKNKKWYTVPLPLPNGVSGEMDYHWRLSFCHQEKEVLTMYGYAKPIIRQMKKLRDVQNWKAIASYYIETLFLNKLTQLQEDWNKIPQTLFLYNMLKELQHACEQHQIKYFWDNHYNLLEKIGKMELYNISCRLNKIIKDIDTHVIENKFVLFTYVLTPDELEQLQEKSNDDGNTTTSRCMIL